MSKKNIEISFFGKLLDEVSKEITTYRQRQITMFREAVIVLAVITWGINQLEMKNNIAEWIIRILASIACISVGYVGYKIIMAYKSRIYYVRKKRTELFVKYAERFNMGDIMAPDFDPFYPVDVGNFIKTYKTTPTSKIYTAALISISVLTTFINILSGFAT